MSRVVEPQTAVSKEKSFSLAAALPRPCYASLMSQLSSSSLRSEERLAFSETEHTPLHVAQQLTLLEQVPETPQFISVSLIKCLDAYTAGQKFFVF